MFFFTVGTGATSSTTDPPGAHLHVHVPVMLKTSPTEPTSIRVPPLTRRDTADLSGGPPPPAAFLQRSDKPTQIEHGDGLARRYDMANGVPFASLVSTELGL